MPAAAPGVTAPPPGSAPLGRGAGFALLSAGLFGVSAPLAKLLLRGVAPQLLAGILYVGSGAGLAAP